MKEDKRKLISNTAKDILLQKGISKTRVEDITSFLNIAKGSFYLHYKSKAELLEEIIEEMFKIKNEKILKIKNSELSIIEKIEAFIRIEDFLSENEVKSYMILFRIFGNDEFMTPKITEMIKSFQKIDIDFFNDLILKLKNNNISEIELNMKSMIISASIRKFRLDQLLALHTQSFPSIDPIKFVSIWDLEKNIVNIKLLVKYVYEIICVSNKI